MSGYKMHLLFYLAIAVTGLAVAQRYSPLSLGLSKTLIGVAIGAFYSLLPDVDTPSSVMRRLFGRVFLAAILASLAVFTFWNRDVRLLYMSMALALFLYVLWFVRHRGMLHTPVFAVISSAPLYLVEPSWAVFAFAGFMTHLILDGEVFK